MVQSTNFLPLLLLPTLTLSAPGHHHQHRHPALVKRARVTSTTWTIVHVTQTVTVDGSESTVVVPTPSPAVVEVKSESIPEGGVFAPVESKVAEPSEAEVEVAKVEPTTVEPAKVEPTKVETPSSSSKVEEKPKSTSTSSTPATGSGGKVIFKNACSYDVKFDLIRTLSECGSDIHDEPLKAGASWTSDLTPCEGANPALKVYRSGDNSKKNPFQFEFGYKPSQSMAWYNLSPKDCVSDMYGAGLENCVGGPWYIDATSGHVLGKDAQQCRTYQCSDATSCCTENAYCDAFATAARQLGGLEPVSGCPGTVDEISIVMQIC